MFRAVESCRTPFPNSLRCDMFFLMDSFPNSILVQCNDSKAYDPSSGCVGAIITLWFGFRGVFFVVTFNMSLLHAEDACHILAYLTSP